MEGPYDYVGDFERSSEVIIRFTQAGLTPALECYTNCEKGWNFYIGESLRNLINTGAGKPDTSADKRE